MGVHHYAIWRPKLSIKFKKHGRGGLLYVTHLYFVFFLPSRCCLVLIFLQPVVLWRYQPLHKRELLCFFSFSHGSTTIVRFRSKKHRNNSLISTNYVALSCTATDVEDKGLKLHIYSHNIVSINKWYATNKPNT